MRKNNNLIERLDPIQTTEAYDTYWRFAYERQNIFYKRLKGYCPGKLTDDPILTKYKFTNTYRACDRVSQYLIKEIIYKDSGFSETDIFLRIILFKLFNKIETWELLQEKFGDICYENFKVNDFKKFLDSEMNKGRVLYSNAYMMSSGTKEFNVTRKHHAHLKLIQMMLNDSLVKKIQDCKYMRDAYLLLLEYPLIGTFLAYQYITDINYSNLTDFSESEFTIPGPGAKDGIRKCFHNLGGLTETDIIKLMYDRQEYEFDRLGLKFKRLGNRSLQYIDIQNIFCETDKYCRVAHPEIKGLSGRTRIKQLYKYKNKPISFYFPPKWKINLGET